MDSARDDALGAPPVRVDMIENHGSWFLDRDGAWHVEEWGVWRPAEGPG